MNLVHRFAPKLSMCKHDSYSPLAEIEAVNWLIELYVSRLQINLPAYARSTYVGENECCTYFLARDAGLAGKRGHGVDENFEAVLRAYATHASEGEANFCRLPGAGH